MSENDDAKAVVLLSGGLDSATTLAVARREGFACHALSFDYGQRHRFELAAAQRVARAGRAASRRLVRLDLSAAGGFGRSALTDDIDVPKDRFSTEERSDQRRFITESTEERRSSRKEIDSGTTNGKTEAPDDVALPGNDSLLSFSVNSVPSVMNNGVVASPIPVTYVPARNTIFLSIALGYAEVIGAFDIFIGVNAIDYSGYPDCRPEFIEAFERTANLATAAGVAGRGRFRIRAPLIRMTKAEIIRVGLELGVDYSLTHSCYDPSPEGLACGRCDACRLRLKGFAEAGATDPAKYQPGATNS